MTKLMIPLMDIKDQVSKYCSDHWFKWRFILKYPDFRILKLYINQDIIGERLGGGCSGWPMHFSLQILFLGEGNGETHLYYKCC